MTVERLKGYKKLVREIAVLKWELNELQTTEAGLGNSVIKDYTKGFARPQTVVGFDGEKYGQKRRLYDDKEAEAEEVREWIEGIEEAETRKVFEYFYLEDLTWRKIAKKMGYGNNPDYPRVCIRDAYLKKSGIK